MRTSRNPGSLTDGLTFAAFSGAGRKLQASWLGAGVNRDEPLGEEREGRWRQLPPQPLKAGAPGIASRGHQDVRRASALLGRCGEALLLAADHGLKHANYLAGVAELVVVPDVENGVIVTGGDGGQAVHYAGGAGAHEVG